MRISNSASLNRTGRAVNDLRTAINRLGYNMVRSAAISFAMAQIRNANKLAGLEPYLDDLWRQSTRVAAFSYVLARTCSEVNPDEAMLAGMMHGIGKLYVLTRATSHVELFADTATLESIISDWHASIGKAILENWDFSEAMADAVGEQHDHSREDVEKPDLRDVLAIAIVMAGFDATDLEGLTVALGDLSDAHRMGLDQEKTRSVIEDCAEEVKALTNALGS
jgi:HD-like signal output (HDOD) protein